MSQEFLKRAESAHEIVLDLEAEAEVQREAKCFAPCCESRAPDLAELLTRAARALSKLGGDPGAPGNWPRGGGMP